MKQKNEQGFAGGGVIVAIAILVVAAVGFAGYRVFQSKDDSSSQNTNSAQQNTSTETVKAETDEEAVQNTAKEHFVLLSKKQYQDAYDTTCEQFKEQESYDSFYGSLQTSGFLTIDFSKVEYTDVEIRNDQAKISGLIGPLVPDKSLSVSLLKNDGNWCIFGYQVK